jgi:hypothetical protein
MNRLSSRQFKEFLLHLSSEVGGCPILNPHFLYRGHPDHFTTYTTFLYHLAQKDQWASRLYSVLSSMKVPFGRADPELLICNPCSVNLKAPQTISNVIRKDLEDILNEVTKNRDLSMIFSESSRDHDHDFYKFLVTCKPCHPRILHEIFRNTIQGTKLAYLSKYKNTKTTRILYGKVRNLQDMGKTLIRIQLSCVDDWLDLYTLTIKPEPSDQLGLLCPTELATQIRSLSWLPVTEASPIEGVTIPHPAHQFKIEYFNTTLHVVRFDDSESGAVDLSQGEYMIFKLTGDCNTQLHTTLGPYTHTTSAPLLKRRSQGQSSKYHLLEDQCKQLKG